MVPVERVRTVGSRQHSILLVAAEAREFSGLDGAVPTRHGAFSLAAVTTPHHRMTLVANGPGPDLARRAIDAAGDPSTFDAVVSIGFCGALIPSLRVGDIVVATRILDGARLIAYAAGVPESNLPYVEGDIVSVNRVAVRPGEKRALAASGAIAVEMEAAAVARWTTSRDLPFFCVRAVSDAADDDLGINFNLMRDAEGRFSRSRIALAALRRPFPRIPQLLRLDRNCRIAAKHLGEFLASCSFTPDAA